MSTTTEELKSELTKVKEIISDRKNKANELKLPGKISEVARIRGEYNNGCYFFSEKGLSIVFESRYIKVNLGHATKFVFSADLLQNGVGDIHLYIPGDWEKRIEELYNDIPEIQRKRDVSSLQKEINKLRKKWQLGEVS